MNILPLISSPDLQTLDDTTTTLLSFLMGDTQSGELTLEVAGELSGDPSTCYGWRNRVSVSCNGGVAVIQATGVAEVLDPAVAGVAVSVDTDGAASIRIRVTGVAGQTWNWCGKLQCVVHSAVPSGTTAFYDPSVAASCTPYQDVAYDGAELATNPGCDNLGFWTAFSSATLSLVAGHTGNCVQAVRNGVNAPGAQQTAAIPSNARFRASAWLNLVAPASTVYAMVGTNAIASATGAGWTLHSNNNVFSGAGIVFRSGANGAVVDGAGVQIDDVSLVRQPILTQCDNLINAACCPLVQPGAASARPTYLNDAAAAAQGVTGGACFQYDAVGQYWVTSFVPTGDFTAGGWFYVESIAAGSKAFLGSYDVGGATFCQVIQSAANLSAYCGAAGSALAHGTALTVGWHHIIFGRSGTTLKLWLDGVGVANVLATDPPARALYVMARNRSVSTDLFGLGYTGKLLFVNRLLTDAEVLSNMYSTLRS